jgi:aspartate-semialdehyde dehydrogenase
MRPIDQIAVVGGGESLAGQVVELLLERDFEMDSIRLLDDEERAGSWEEIAGHRVKVGPATAEKLAGIDAALFCDDGRLARELVQVVRTEGALVVDGSPFSRRFGTGPIVVPEVNAARIEGFATQGVIASPTSAAVGLSVALAPLRERFGLRRVVTTVLEPASQRGAEAIEELSRQAIAMFQGQGPDQSDEGQERIAFNIRPLGDSSLPGVPAGFALEEHVCAMEVAALFGEPRVMVLPTFLRVPVFCGASQVVYAELERAAELEELEALYRGARGLLLAGAIAAGGEPSQEMIESGEYRLELDERPGPLDVNGSEAVHVGRIRRDPARPEAVSFWLAYDDQRKGVALNMVASLELARRRAALRSS